MGAKLATANAGPFPDRENGGFFDTSDDHENLLYRPKNIQDNATPSGNAMAVQVLLKLSLYTGEGTYWDVAHDALIRTTGLLARYPTGFAHWLNAAAFTLGDPREVAIIGRLEIGDTRQMLTLLTRSFRPNLVLAAGEAARLCPCFGTAADGRESDSVCVPADLSAKPRSRMSKACWNNSLKSQTTIHFAICACLNLCYTVVGSPQRCFP